MAVIDYAKTPAVAVREMAEMYKRSAESDRKTATLLLERAEGHEEKSAMWLRAAEAIEASS